jgi:hypothetical protein
MVVKDQGARGRTLANKLRDLATKETIPSPLADIAEQIRDFGNIGAHADVRDLRQNEAALLHDLCVAILEYVYAAPELVGRAQAALKKYERDKAARRRRLRLNLPRPRRLRRRSFVLGTDATLRSTPKSARNRWRAAGCPGLLSRRVLSQRSHRRPGTGRIRWDEQTPRMQKTPCKTGLRVSRRDRPGPRFTGSNPVGATKKPRYGAGFFGARRRSRRLVLQVEQTPETRRSNASAVALRLRIARGQSAYELAEATGVFARSVPALEAAAPADKRVSAHLALVLGVPRAR